MESNASPDFHAFRFSSIDPTIPAPLTPDPAFAPSPAPPPLDTLIAPSPLPSPPSPYPDFPLSSLQNSSSSGSGPSSSSECSGESPRSAQDSTAIADQLAVDVPPGMRAKIIVRVRAACVHCRQVKAACGDQRPCVRCIRVGKQATCVDFVPARPRKRKMTAVVKMIPIDPNAPPPKPKAKAKPKALAAKNTETSAASKQIKNPTAPPQSGPSAAGAGPASAPGPAPSAQNRGKLVTSKGPSIVPLPVPSNPLPAASLHLHSPSPSQQIPSLNPNPQHFLPPAALPASHQSSGIDPFRIQVPGPNPSNSHTAQLSTPNLPSSHPRHSAPSHPHSHSEATRHPSSHPSQSLAVTVLPKAAPQVMRMYNVTFLNMIRAIHLAGTDSSRRNQQILTAMAYMVHNFSHISPEYERILIDEFGATPDAGRTHSHYGCACPAINDSPNTSSFRCSSNRTVSDASDYVDIDTDQLRTRSMVPRDIALDSLQSLLAFFSSQNHSDQSPIMGSISPGTRTHLNHCMDNLPPLLLPQSAAPSELQVYAVLNSWRNIPQVREIIQRYYSTIQAVEMNVFLEGERYRCRDIPFGVVLYPLYPRPFSIYRAWVNERFALMLGRTHEEMLEIVGTRRSHYSMYHIASVDLMNSMFYNSIATGRQNYTFPMGYNHKSGRIIQTYSSIRVKYINCMPMYLVVYVQELPSRAWEPPPQISAPLPPISTAWNPTMASRGPFPPPPVRYGSVWRDIADH